MDQTPKYTMRLDLAPLVVFTIHGDMSLDDIDAMFESWRTVFARKERFVSLSDARGAKSMPSAKERARVAEGIRSIESLSVRYSLGNATIVSSPLIRGALTAIEWIQKPKVASAYFGSMIEGCDWCMGRLSGAGLPTTPGIAAFRAGLVDKGARRTGAA
jgi:hypothetical protein